MSLPHNRKTDGLAFEIDTEAENPLYVSSRASLFPGGMQVIHCVDVRDLAMLDWSKECGGLLVMGVLRPGWEIEKEHRAGAVEPTCCLGQVVYEERLDLGRRLAVIRGMMRCVIVTRREAETGANVVRLAPIPDVIPSKPIVDRFEQQQEILLQAAKAVTGKFALELLNEVSRRLDDLGRVCDLITQALPLPTKTRQLLLEEPNIDTRSALLLEGISQLETVGTGTPLTQAGFGVN